VITLLPIFVLGALIVLSSARLIVQSSRKASGKKVVTVDDYVMARTELDEVLVANASIQRIFAREDLEFVSRNNSPAVHRLFRDERRKLALLWVRNSQKRLAHLMDVHLRLASYTRRPCPQIEIRVAAQYFAFLVASYFVLGLLWLCGPFAAAGIIHYVLDVPGNLCTAFAPRLEDVDVVRLEAGADRRSA
jgi:hypothetical protein